MAELSRRESWRARLPSPGVAFEPDFRRRLARVRAPRGARASEAEGPGRAARPGAGLEFAGYRAYRPGDDARWIDWSLYARSGRPYVRLSRRETAERWLVLLDTSASMGVGRPGKLQRAAELAAGVCALALRARASARVLAVRSGIVASAGVRSAAELDGLLRWLESLQAVGARGLSMLCEPRLLARATRVIAIGDLFDCAPADLACLRARGRELSIARVLAAEELLEPPPAAAEVEWIDAESAAALRTRLDARSLSAYRERLGRQEQGWRRLAARWRARYALLQPREPFENALTRV